MIGYITLGTRDLPRAVAFYDALLGEIGAQHVFEFERGVAWGTSQEHAALSVVLPFDGQPATVGNGVMVALALDSKDKVDRLYAKAMALGASDEGPPGLRWEGFYAAYFRDLDGNKLNFFCMG